MGADFRDLAETIELFAEGRDRSNRPEDRKLASDYLAALAPILAQVTLGRDVLRRLPAIDRLFGNTWIVDVGPFETAFEAWSRFKRNYAASVVSGMTVNERFHAVGKLDEFEAARQSGNKSALERLLREVCVDASTIQQYLDEL